MSADQDLLNKVRFNSIEQAVQFVRNNLVGIAMILGVQAVEEVVVDALQRRGHRVNLSTPMGVIIRGIAKLLQIKAGIDMLK